MIHRIFRNAIVHGLVPYPHENTSNFRPFRVNGRLKLGVCTVIPSKNGLKLGFYKGNDLPDPGQLLKGNGKISRYVEIKAPEDVYSGGLIALIKAAFAAYKARNGK